VTTAVADVRRRLNVLLDTIPLVEWSTAHSDEQHAPGGRRDPRRRR